MQRLGLALLLLAPVLAGCLGVDSAGLEEGPPAIPMQPATTLALEDCTGFSLSLAYPGPVAPMPVPPGYESPNQLAPILSNIVTAFDCQRVGFGELERPAFVAIERSNHAVPPQECREGSGGRFGWIVSQIWTNDPEMASAFEVLTPRVTLVGLQLQDADPPFTSVWTWHGANVRIADLGDQEETEPDGMRWFFPRGPESEAYIDIDSTGRMSSTTPPVAEGRIEGSFMNANDGNTIWQATTFTGFDTRGVIRFFDSGDCS